ncbi:MAG: DNA-3-methyladenine glycosylase [Negativicutes bacterium]|nr:DNA-3-methyladenine glycosylase [Negativicutes bacterium]
MHKLPLSYYQQNSLTLAKDLLGKYLVHVSDEGKTVGKIVETEAYRGPLDAAAHSYSGKPTERTKIMFGLGGYVYIYLIYGMHYCMNIVAGAAGFPEVVLLRALEPLDGIPLMKQRRKTDKLLNLCSGPGKLCAAMGITKKQYGISLCSPELHLLDGEKVAEDMIARTPRINIGYSGEAVDYPWRYIIKESKFISV